MGGIGDMLFGSGGDMEVTSPEQGPRLTPAQRALLDKLSSILSAHLGSSQGVYPGPLVAPASPLQEQYFNILMPEGTAGKLLPQASDILSELINPGQTEQFWQTAFVKPAMTAWEKDVVPRIMEHYAGMNAVDSSASRRALSESGRRLQEDLNAELQRILWGERERQTNIAQDIMNLIPVMGQAGAMERGIMQEQITEPYKKWQMSQPWANPWLQYLNTALGVTAYWEPGAIYKPATPGLIPGFITGMAPGFGYWMGAKVFGGPKQISNNFTAYPKWALEGIFG